MENNFIISLIASLDEAKSKEQINADLKQLQKTINMLRLTGTFAKGETKQELNTYIDQLSSQLSAIKLKAKIDSKNIKKEVDKALTNVSFKDIDALDIDENKTKLKLRKVIASAKSYADKNPIPVNLELKQAKLNNDLTTYLNKNTKISESPSLLKEAENVRSLISAVGDKQTLRNATDAFKLYKSEVSATGHATKSTADKIKDMLSNAAKIGSMFSVASLAVNNLSKSLGTLRNIDDILTEISKTSDLTAQELEKLGNTSFKAASKYGKSASDYLIGIQEMSRSGFYGEKGAAMAEQSLLAQAAGDMSAEVANNYILATNAAYKYNGEAAKLNAVLDGQNSITNRSSVSLEDMAVAMSKAGTVASSYRVSIEDLSAMIGTIEAVTKAEGGEVGNAIKSILINLQNVNSSKIVDTLDAANASMTTFVDGTEKLRDPISILRDLAATFNKLDEDDALRAEILTNIGGKHQSSKLAALLQNMKLFDKMLVDYSEGAGSALEEALKSANNWSGRLNQVQNSWDSLVNALISKNTVLGSISFFDRLIQGAETLIDTIGEIPVVLTTLNTAMTALNADYGITQLINPETKKLDVQGNIFGIDFSAIKEQKKHFREVEDAIFAWNNMAVIREADYERFGNALSKNQDQFTSYLRTLSVDAPASLDGYKAHLNAAGVSTDALRLKTILLNSAISLGVGVAVQAAVQGISYLIQKEENLRQTTEEAAKAYKESASSVDDYVAKYEDLHKALIAAKGNEEETYNVKKQLLELQTELNDKFGDEYGAINLVTDAYKDQTEAIKELNKETAQTFLNENQAGIDKAENAMTKDRHYNLSLTGMSGYTDEGVALMEIVRKYEKQGISLFDEMGDGSFGQFSVHLDADAQSAYETINLFENDLRQKAKELGDAHMFDDVLAMSSNSLNEAKKTIDKYGDIYNQALTAEIVSDDNLVATYHNALKAIEEYNDAVLKSEDAYNDENVLKAKSNLDAIKESIHDNESEWGKYADLMDDVFDQADTRLIEFDNALKTDTGLQKYAENLKGLTDLDLKSFDEIGGNDFYEKLKESAEEYGLSVEELTDALVRLGYVQGEVADGALGDAFEAEKLSLSDTIAQLDELKDKFEVLDQTYAKLFDTDASIGFEDLSAINTAFADIDGIDNFIQRLQEAGQNTEEVTAVMQDLIAAYLDYSGILDMLTEENAALIEQFLTEMGIENAHEIVLQRLSAETEALALQKQFLTEKGYELIDATLEEINQFINESNASDVTKQSLAQLAMEKIDLANINFDESGNIAQLISLANAAGASAEAMVRAKSAMNTINEINKKGANGTAADFHRLDYASLTVQEIKDKTYDWQYKKLNPKDFIVSTSPKYTSGSASRYTPQYSGGTATKKAIDDAAKDAEKQANKAEKEAEKAEKEAKKAEDKYKETIDLFDQRAKVLNAALSLLKTNLDNVTGAFAKNQLVDAQLGITEEKFKNYSDALNMYTQKANEALSKLPSDIAAKVKDGAVDLTTFIGEGNKDVVEAIKDYENWSERIADCKNQLAELKGAIRQLELQKFENIAEDFTNQFDLREDSKSLISKQIALLEEAGELIGESFFNAQIDQSKKQLALLEEEKAQLVSQMESAINSGRVEKATDEWLSMANSISNVEGEILNCQKSIEEFSNSLLSLNWKIFERIQDQFGNISSELDNLAGLFDDFNDIRVSDGKGTWTREAIATLGLYAQQYEVAKYQVEQYSDAMDKLKQDYIDGRFSAIEYLDKLADLSSGQWDAVKSAESLEDSIYNLNKTRIDEEITTIEDEVDAFKKLTDELIKNLEAQEELYQHKKKLSEMNKTIADLERQLAAMQNDNSQSAIARRKKLEDELKNARQDLADYEHEYSIDQQKEALNSEHENFENLRNQEIESLRLTLENRELLISQSFENVKANADIVGQEIANIAVQHGVTVSDAIITSWQNGEGAIASYGNVLNNATSAFIGNLMGVEYKVYDLQNQANATADTLAWMFGTRADTLVNELTTSYYSEQNLANMTNALQQSLVNALERGYNISSITNALGSVESAARSAKAAIDSLNSTPVNTSPSYNGGSGDGGNNSSGNGGNGSGSSGSNIRYSGGYDERFSNGNKYNLINVYTGRVDESGLSYSQAWEKQKKTGMYEIKKMAKGGIVTKDPHSPLNAIAEAVGEDTIIAAKEGEAVITEKQTDSLRKFVDSIGGYKDGDVYVIPSRGRSDSQVPLENMSGNLAALDPVSLSNNIRSMPEVMPNNVDKSVNNHVGSLVTINGNVNDTHQFINDITKIAQNIYTKGAKKFVREFRYG